MDFCSAVAIILLYMQIQKIIHSREWSMFSRKCCTYIKNSIKNWLVTCARKSKVSSWNPAATYVQSCYLSAVIARLMSKVLVKRVEVVVRS